MKTPRGLINASPYRVKARDSFKPPMGLAPSILRRCLDLFFQQKNLQQREVLMKLASKSSRAIDRPMISIRNRANPVKKPLTTRKPAIQPLGVAVGP
jgi:hypothetical protein